MAPWIQENDNILLCFKHILYELWCPIGRIKPDTDTDTWVYNASELRVLLDT